MSNRNKRTRNELERLRLPELQARFPATTYATAAAREVAHVLDPDHGHSHGDERP